MTDPRPDAAPPPAPPAVTSLPWHGLGTVLAAAAVGLVGYVAFSTVELVGLASSDTASASPVADPPPLATYSSAPESAEPGAHEGRRAVAERPAPGQGLGIGLPVQGPRADQGGRPGDAVRQGLDAHHGR